MINYQKSSSENIKVSWIVAYYLLALDPSVATLDFAQVYPEIPRTAWE